MLKARLIVLPLLLLLAWFPCRGFAAEMFPGYPADVRTQALALLEAAAPGNEKALEQEAEALRKVMLDYSIISINEVPERVFERAQKEGWEGKASEVLRPLTFVAPLSLSLWAWLAKEDFGSFRIGRFFHVIEGLLGTLYWYGPAFAGCLTWLFLCVVAAASWFAIWASFSLLLRAQPAITADFTRFFSKLPRPEILAFAIFIVFLMVPVFTGVGLGVAVIFWFALSARSLRRWETMTAVLSILLLAAVYVCGGVFHSTIKHVEPRKGGWFGVEGHLPLEWPVMEAGKTESPRRGPRWEDMALFARARAVTQAGRYDLAELLWTKWIQGAPYPSPGYNNRGVVRHRLGMIPEALEDFEKSMNTGFSFGPAYWNSYQLYLETLRLEDATKVQEGAWISLRKMSQFDYHDEKLRRGELLPSPFLVNDLWKRLFVPDLRWLKNSEESFISRFLFKPLPNILVLPFAALGCLWMLLRRVSSKAGKRGPCRACGVSAPAETDIDDGICGRCRERMGGETEATDAPDPWIDAIKMHRRYVKICSTLLPGAGAFWAGKTVSLLIYGILLSLLLGVLTVSMGAETASSSLVSGMMKGVVPATSAALLVLWVLGAVWSRRSFDKAMRKCGGEKR